MPYKSPFIDHHPPSVVTEDDKYVSLKRCSACGSIGDVYVMISHCASCGSHRIQRIGTGTWVDGTWRQPSIEQRVEMVRQSKMREILEKMMEQVRQYCPYREFVEKLNSKEKQTP